MRTLSRSAIALVIAAGLSGCAAHKMEVVSSPEAVTESDPKKAIIVFYKPSEHVAFRPIVISSSNFSPLYDVTGGKLDFLGNISFASKFAYAAAPGKRRYMLVSESADFIDVDALAGKTYYIRVDSKTGYRFFRANLNGMPASTPGLKKELENCQWIESPPSSFKWAAERSELFRKRYDDFLPGWLKSKYREFLGPQDGE